MLISKGWLKKFIPDIVSYDDEVVAEKLTQSLAEVEQVVRVGYELEKLVCGKVLEVKKHPKADKLKVCNVDVGTKKLQIVCGANNVAKDQKVVVCLEGGSVISPENGEKYKIKAAKLRGIESQGMICSEKELGISDEHKGILVLPESFEIGEEFDDYLRDSVFEIENKSLTHRGDCFSHLGIARELSAILDIDFLAPEDNTKLIATEVLPAEIQVETKNCTRFYGVTIKGIEVTQSPLWLKLMLTKIGITPVNNIVDLTNYIMHDLGQPMHAYDYDKIEDNKLIIRDARKGEKLQAINHKKYTLDKDDIVITDAKKIQSIAGIMGSTTSEVDESTTNVLLEAAVFDPVQILKTSRKQGIRSEAGIRFSKGVDVTKTKNALEECANLIVEMTQADIASEVLEIKSEEFKVKELDFDLNLTEEIAGTEIDTEQMLIFLQRLGIEVVNRNEIDVTNTSQINVPVIAKLRIPTWRRDLNIPEDIVEEIVRIFGYNNIEPRLLDVKSEFNKLPEIGNLNRKVRANMLEMGFNEVITYSFISDQLKELFSIKDRQLVKITNAISPELNYFRNSLLPSLIEVYNKNQDNYEDISIFEIGRTVNNYEYNDEKIPEQHWKLGVLKSTQAAANNRKVYLEFKGMIEKLLEMLGFAITDYKWEVFKPEKSVFFENSFHEYRASNLTIKGEIIGGLGEVDPFVVEKITKKHVKIFFSQIDLKKLLEIHNKKLEESRDAVEVDLLPSVKRDLSFWIKERQKLGEIFDELHEMTIKSAKQIKIKPEIMDEYFAEEDDKKKKNTVQKDQKRSVTFSLEIQPKKDTLTDEEANKIIDEIIDHLTKKFAINLRGE